jgi:crotonobetainyl-CoA:carnitine CoA-transferase CaiB-like acyl-CoA transferase
LNQTENRMPLPLEGIIIVEYGVFHAGPGAGAILGDMGAEIIKIESGVGDPERYWTKISSVNMAMEDGESLMFEVSNRNKRGIYLDIKTDAGRDILHRLITRADVFLTNLRKSTRRNLEIDYDSLRPYNEKLIYAVVSGYGAKGPMSDMGAFDPLGQAVSGMTFVTGTDEPVLMHLGILDQATAITASHAIMSALLVRERRGIGQEVHLSLYSTALWLQHPNLVLDSVLGIDPCLRSQRTSHSPLRNRFKCKDDGWIMGTHHPEQKYWATFCRLMGLEGLLNDPLFTDEAGRPIPGAEILQKCDAIIATRNRDEWIDIFLNNGLMFCPVRHIREVKKDPQALANDYMKPFMHPRLGEIMLPGFPVSFSACRTETRRAAPAMGEHTDEILKELGYTADDIQALKQDGIVRQEA